MPLDILLVLVVGGIAGIAILLHVTGRSERKRFSPDTIAASWARHFPEDNLHDCLLAQNKEAALVTTDQGIGLIWAFGADDVARVLTDYDLRPYTKGLHFTFHDYATPGVWLTLTNQERTIWTKRLKSI